MVVSIASIRRGAFDLAVGNLRRSNCFNMLVLCALDIADGPGSLLAQVESGIVIGAAFSITLMAQALIEVLHRSERRLWFVQPNALVLLVTYGVRL